MSHGRSGVANIECKIHYCDYQLERIQRLHRQMNFLNVQIDVLGKKIANFEETGAGRVDNIDKVSLSMFIAKGLLGALREEKELLEQERNGLIEKLKGFERFDLTREAFEKRKQMTLRDLPLQHSRKLRKIGEDFGRIERRWNCITEDLLRLGQGLGFLKNNLDYLRSCRTFIVMAKGEFDPDQWFSSDLSYVFRHSFIGRAKEMAQGADRNLKMAQNEFAGLCEIDINKKPPQFLHTRFLEAVYDDVFIAGSIGNSIRIVESVLSANIHHARHVKEKEEHYTLQVKDIEKERAALYAQLCKKP